MNVGARVTFYGDWGAPPRLATVVARAGTCWAQIRCDDGELIEQVFIATSRFQCPQGHYCTPL